MNWLDIELWETLFGFSGVRPRLLHHYRGHKMSIWLSLIPQLQKTGQNSIYPSHNSLLLNGPSWGVVRNSSSAGRWDYSHIT